MITDDVASMDDGSRDSDRKCFYWVSSVGKRQGEIDGRRRGGNIFHKAGRC